MEAKKFQETDKGKLVKTRSGTINRGWVNKTLQDKGFECIDAAYQP